MATAVLVIDLQQEFARRTAAGWPRSNSGAEARVAQVLAWARGAGVPVIHIHHDDPRPESGFRLAIPGGQPMPCAEPRPGEKVVVKHQSSAFAGTGLAGMLRARGIDRLIVLGAAVNYCVSSTVRAARDEGIAVDLVEDAVFGFGIPLDTGAEVDADTILRATLATLGAGFARRITADALTG
jgi:nicotinamidase-related amidase